MLLSINFCRADFGNSVTALYRALNDGIENRSGLLLGACTLRTSTEGPEPHDGLPMTNTHGPDFTQRLCIRTSCPAHGPRVVAKPVNVLARHVQGVVIPLSLSKSDGIL